MMKMACVCYEGYMTPCANFLLLQEHGMTVGKLLWDDKTCLLQPCFHAVCTIGWSGFWGNTEFSHSEMLTFSSTLFGNIIWSRHGQWLGGFHAVVAGLDGLRREVSWLVEFVERWSYFLAWRAASVASMSSSSFRVCHWAIGRRGLASMSDQCFSSVPEALLPIKIFPMASFFPILS